MFLVRALTALLLVVSPALGGEPIVLTDKTFEHDTQAATGGTTGPWLVKFYAPWCGHCKKLAPVWDQLVDELEGQVNVAKVDAVANPSLGRRFDIKGYPTLIFLDKGKLIRYTGDRSLESLKDFALGGYESIKYTKIPGVPTFMDTVKYYSKFVADDLWFMLRRHVAGSTFLLSAGIVMGIFVGLSIASSTKAPTKTNSVRPPRPKKE